MAIDHVHRNHERTRTKWSVKSSDARPVLTDDSCELSY